MRILLSNDDGIFAPGLSALHAAVKRFGEVTVIAPESARSASGHSITIHKPLVVQHVPPNGPEEFAGISVDGSPADCVRLAIRRLLPEPPELVCTGINAGANVGINVFYSGTVAAAAEAAILGIPAVAFSADAAAEPIDYARVSRLAGELLGRIMEVTLSPGDLLNVNFPALTGEELRGVRVVPQSNVEIEDAYHRETDSAGQVSYQLGKDYRFGPAGEGTDVSVLAAGYVTITPLRVDMTNHAQLAHFAGLNGDAPRP